jgi:hypothetical protein
LLILWKKQVLIFFSKEQKWEFEEEYRTHKFWEYFANDNQRKIKLRKDCYSEIIFGSEMPEVNKSQIESICNSTKLNVKFKECIIEGNEIKIKEWFSR